MTGRRLLTGALVAGLLAVAGCGGSDTEPVRETGSFVGRLAGSDAFVALVTNGEVAEGYVCDGRTGKRFTGTLDGARAELLADDGTRLVATLRDGRAQGTLAEGGRELAFTADAARGEAGYYRAEAPDGRRLASWIVLADGRQRGVRQAGAATGGTRPQPSDIGRQTGDQAPAGPIDKFEEAKEGRDPPVRPVRPQDLSGPEAEEGLG